MSSVVQGTLMNIITGSVASSLHEHCVCYIGSAVEQCAGQANGSAIQAIHLRRDGHWQLLQSVHGAGAS